MRVDSFAKLEMLLVLQKNKPLLLSKKSSFECIIGGELTDDNFFFAIPIPTGVPVFY